jgi:outer membrane murein-binding lipoprotein Lpp
MRKMISSIVLLALVSSMIFSSISVSVYADSQSDSIIRIASQARDQVKIQLSKVDMTPEIKEKFELGSEQIELLIEAAKNEDDTATKQHFLSAMKIFNDIIQQISERTSASESALSNLPTTVDTSRITNELDRLERYVSQLKRIAINNEFGLDSSKCDGLIAQARNDLRDGNSDSAISTIQEIKQSITELNQILKEKTREYATDRAKTLAGKHLEDLDRLIEEAEEMEVSDDTIDRLLEARKNLNSLSDASVEQIINEVKRIMSIKQDFEKSRVDRIESRYQDLESKIDRLSSYSSDIPELDKAKTMYSELRDLVSTGSYNEAIRLLNSLNNLLNEIQNSINDKEEVAAAAEERQISSLSDSKKDRIKIKIQRLELNMNQLEEKVEDNAASKRWLNNAFSLLEDAKNQVDNSPDYALKTIMKIQEIIKRINTMQ